MLPVVMRKKIPCRLSGLMAILLIALALLALQAGLSHAQALTTAGPQALAGNGKPPSFSRPGVPGEANGILQLEARMAEGGPIIKQGVIWRIFSTEIGLDNKLLLIAHTGGGQAEFMLAPGNYLIHAAFGKAGVIRHLTLEAGKTLSETIVLNAGGIKLNAVLPDGKINESQLKFSIYSDASENNEQSLIIANIKPETIVRLNAGVYHVVSNYGTANAIVRSDIRVEAGKLTEATMQQQAAQITLKLVRQKGGEALADTSWAIMNDSGDIVREIANAYAYIILAEGEYVAVAKNKDQIYQKEFSVSSGKDEEIDVLAIPQNSADNDALD